MNQPKPHTLCSDCHKLLIAGAEGDAAPVKHTNRKWYHKDCLELFLWRKETKIFKKAQGSQKIPHACGRIVRSSRNLGG